MSVFQNQYEFRTFTETSVGRREDLREKKTADVHVNAVLTGKDTCGAESRVRGAKRVYRLRRVGV